MTIHEMLQQVALYSSGKYRREGATSVIEIPLPEMRRQVIYGKSDIINGEKVGVLSTRVGKMYDGIELKTLLRLNAAMRFSRVTLQDDDVVSLIAVFDIMKTSVKECAPMLQEIASIADELEREYFHTDES